MLWEGNLTFKNNKFIGPPIKSSINHNNLYLSPKLKKPNMKCNELLQHVHIISNKLIMDYEFTRFYFNHIKNTINVCLHKNSNILSCGQH